MKTLIIISLLFFSGCITQDKCLQRFPPEVKETITIVTETVTVTRDTVIYVQLEPEMIYQTDTVKIDVLTGLIQSERSHLETSLAWSVAQVQNSKLHHELHQKDTLIEFKLQNAITEIERLQKELREKVTTIEVPRKLTAWQKLLMGLGWITIGGIISIIGLVILRFK
jgi:hypothetical protein